MNELSGLPHARWRVSRTAELDAEPAGKLAGKTPDVSKITGGKPVDDPDAEPAGKLVGKTPDVRIITGGNR